MMDDDGSWSTKRGRMIDITWYYQILLLLRMICLKGTHNSHWHRSYELTNISQTHHGVLWSSQCRHCVGVHGFGWMKFTEIRRFQIWCFFRVNLPGKMESWLQRRWEAMILTTCSEYRNHIMNDKMDFQDNWKGSGSNKLQIRHEFLGAWCQLNTWIGEPYSWRFCKAWGTLQGGEAMNYVL